MKEKLKAFMDSCKLFNCSLGYIEDSTDVDRMNIARELDEAGLIKLSTVGKKYLIFDITKAGSELLT
jgi:hypothetical protein